MNGYILSELADADLTDIYCYSYQNFGAAKAEAYLLSLEDCFDLLAMNNDMGTSINDIREGYFQHNHNSHAIFYRKFDDDILIMRILHKSMEKQRHL